MDFYTDAFLSAIKRWLLRKDCVPAGEFVAQIRKCLVGVSQNIVQNYGVEE